MLQYDFCITPMDRGPSMLHWNQRPNSELSCFQCEWIFISPTPASCFISSLCPPSKTESSSNQIRWFPRSHAAVEIPKESSAFRWKTNVDTCPSDYCAVPGAGVIFLLRTVYLRMWFRQSIFRLTSVWLSVWNRDTTLLVKRYPRNKERFLEAPPTCLRLGRLRISTLHLLKSLWSR